MTEQTVPYQVKQLAKPRTLFDISSDLEKLSELLEGCGGDAQQRELIDNWFEQLGNERDSKLDNYCSLVSQMQVRSQVRKAEAIDCWS